MPCGSGKTREDYNLPGYGHETTLPHRSLMPTPAELGIRATSPISAGRSLAHAYHGCYGVTCRITVTTALALPPAEKVRVPTV